MDKFVPPYPEPHKNRSSFILRLMRGWRSWIDILFERSYYMKMGHVKLPTFDFYMANEPDLVRRILVDEPEVFPKHHLLHKMLKPLLGESIFTTNGEVWKRQRRMMNPAFEHARLQKVFPLMTDAVNAMLERFAKNTESAIVDVDVEMTHVTADIIFRTIMSSPLSQQEAHTIFHAFALYQLKAQRAMMLSIYRLPNFLYVRKSKKAAAEIRNILMPIIKKRYDKYYQEGPGDEQDILSALLDSVDPVQNNKFSYEELVDQVSMLFLAGHETSASALTWALYLIASCPEVQTRLRSEISDIVGNREIEYADIRKLETAWDIFRETLRLYPPVGFFVREPTRDLCMRDKKVKQGSTMMVSPWLLHRNKNYWKNPHAFCPERFSDGSSSAAKKQAYLPFSMGQRVCIGAAFASQEAVLILSRLVQKYEFKSLPDDAPRPVGRVTIRPENGLRLKMTRLKS